MFSEQKQYWHRKTATQAKQYLDTTFETIAFPRFSLTNDRIEYIKTSAWRCFRVHPRISRHHYRKPRFQRGSHSRFVLPLHSAIPTIGQPPAANKVLLDVRSFTGKSKSIVTGYIMRKCSNDGLPMACRCQAHIFSMEIHAKNCFAMFTQEGE